MANPNGRPKVAESEKARNMNLSFKPFYIDHIKKNGGSKYIVRLIDADIASNSCIPQTPQTPPVRPTSGLVERLKKMSEGGE